jgi:very-short-patch-repair endonuclease
VFSCQGAEAGFVVLESALRRGRLDVIGHRALFDLLTVADGKTARLASAESDSGTESMVKLRLIGLGIRFVQQALVGVRGPVDFLIGQRLVVEVDSREHHSDPYRDRQKDAELSIRGYRVLRFMYSQVVHEWPVVERSVLAALSRGDHLTA